MKKYRTNIYLIITIICSLFYYNRCNASISIIGSLTKEYTVSFGEKIEGTITLQNTGKSMTEAKIYQRDYMFFCDGSIIYGDPAKEERSNASWIRFNPSYLVIPAKVKVIVNFIITIPNASSLKGTYWSVLMIEEVPPTYPRFKNRGIAIKSVVRYGVQMITHLGNTGIRNLKFIGSRVINEQNKLLLEVDLKNTGQRLLRPFLWVELYEDSGKKVGRFDGRKMRTYPNTSIRQRVDLSKISIGSYKALVVADCGGEDIYGITYTLKNEK